MKTVPPEEHIHFAKLDLADGYWRMLVEESEQWNFAYVMPRVAGEEATVVVPRAVQMGWNESPAYFCAATETVRDVAQHWIDSKKRLNQHPLEHYATPRGNARRQSSGGPGWQMSGVYVDDFCLAAVENRKGTLLKRTARATMHAIHNVFPTPEATGTPDAKDPISEKKLKQGDGRWDTKKEILGYVLDGVARTIQLGDKKAGDMVQEVRAILRKTRVPLAKFRSIVGRLQHAARILPAARSVFTPLNNAMRGLPNWISLGRHKDVREALLDAAALVKDLARRPTHVSELTQKDLDYMGCCDASAYGAGGVWFGVEKRLHPVVWRVEWPTDIQEQVVSEANPNGRLTNSDLEMAGVLLHELVLEATIGQDAMQAAQVAIGCDNSPAVAWAKRMATRSASPTAYRLLRGLAMRQRTTTSAPPAIFHVAGKQNILADTASRRLQVAEPHSTMHGEPNMPNNKQFVSANMFLTVFNAMFPLQQLGSWHNVPPPSVPYSNVISTLRGKRLELRRWTTRIERSHGLVGSPMPAQADLTPGCAVWIKPTSNSGSLPLPPGFALGSSDMAGRLDSSLWRKPSVTWHKPSFWRDTKIPGDPTEPKS
jgi:hypothetical protein